MTSAFEPVRIGAWDLPQRFVMAPLTRNRAGAGMAPTELNAEYYAQRAGAGLIITEGTQPSAVGQGYLDTPGIHSDEQVAGWRLVADAVHAKGGRVVVQLMHAGRIAHPDNKDGLETVAPSALAAPGQIVTATGQQDYPTPRALETDEIPGLVQEFVHAARQAVAAGLDGVEVHAANGYLPHQFLAPTSNQRTDEYGGSPENRARLTVEITRAVAEAIGAERVGIRISPAHNIQGVLEQDEADVAATYESVVEGIAPLGLAYLSILGDPESDLVRDLRKRFDGPVILNTGFSSVTGLADVEDILERDLADVVAVGREFLANPDLVRRWREGAELNTPDDATFYGGGAKGYTDYPTLG
ncbi:alkene reductase [Terracoccus luteus]|uniref:2,4-dienoyl-CoA reductase-like NADH-dependent reductase (Old Yellow Enzyme family) n=1 Tax=Terracoccus luteus TaxID=53356 RepID=A0A839PSM0_9MICO|nr:alkene reductase [Terracoccus luteus]MBB2984965.1 2,4-dienoyl-CoA reductase-like NADH-dependent reductase (Old Yellow Enzyme family) [Terracoccus luteus]MCP2170617.1 2,4-dienoyl-CoA reductase-like NADH-dependent reductase (Old Yellow Enzyme family) [Terracoccus luteus]